MRNLACAALRFSIRCVLFFGPDESLEGRCPKNGLCRLTAFEDRINKARDSRHTVSSEQCYYENGFHVHD